MGTLEKTIQLPFYYRVYVYIFVGGVYRGYIGEVTQHDGKSNRKEHGGEIDTIHGDN